MRIALAVALIASCLVCIACSPVNGSESDWHHRRDETRLGRLLWQLRKKQLRNQCWKYNLDSLSVGKLSNCALRFIRFANQHLRKQARASSVASFNYNVNINEGNRKMKALLDARIGNFYSRLTLYALKFRGRRLRLSTADARMLRSLQWGQVFEHKRDSYRLSQLGSALAQTYNTAAGCYAPGACLGTGEDTAKEFFRTNFDYANLRYLWKSWRDNTGPKLRQLFIERARLLNNSVQPAGFANYAFFNYYTDFEDAKFPETVVSLYNQIKPLYEQLHGYLRHRLLRRYPGQFAPNGRLPDHLGNDPWGSQYHKWDREFAPYPNATRIDFDAILKDREKRGLLKVMQLPHIADDFYRSLGLPKMTNTFWRNSVFLKSKAHKMNCHGTAYDMCSLQRDDFRIKMCTRMDMSSFSTVHHEMGHIMYFMKYSHQPYLFQAGANSGFHEAIGDTITLSVKTAKHFKAIHFVEELNDSVESQVNTQLTQALENVMFLPYAMVMDLWKWRYFSGQTPEGRLNEDWWRLRSLYQGIGPSVTRSDADLDALSKYHVVLNIGYIRYFISFLLKFQFYKAMCDQAGHTGPLSTCDFYESKAAGEKLGRMLAMGRSKPWPDALEQLTGSKQISADALLEYFKPLHDWLKDYNAKHSVPVGWSVPQNPMESASN